MKEIGNQLETSREEAVVCVRKGELFLKKPHKIL